MGRLLIKGKIFEPIRVGDLNDWYADSKDAVCGDCKAENGEQHYPGCDIERCPLCGGQLLTCECGEVLDIEDDATEEQIEQMILKQKLELERKQNKENEEELTNA